MTSPIDKLIDSVVVCVRCGKSPSSCDCWVKLGCPCCKRVITTFREWHDLPGAKRLEYPCGECLGEDDAVEIRYFDAEGKEITDGEAL